MTDTKAYEPPVFKHRDDDPNDERVLIFSITQANPDYDPNLASYDGGESMEPANPPTIVTPYTMSAKPNVGLALAYLKMARKIGTELAGSWLIEQSMGEQAYDALAGDADLTPEDLETIIAKVEKIALGGLEGPKGS